MKKIGHGVAFVATLMMTLPAIARAEDFYETRLRDGETAYRERRLPDAADNLRIAAFGLLENPHLEAEALAYLALTQSALGRGVESDATLGRFLEVERRFAPYAKANLDPAARAEFQALLRRRVAESTLLAYPGLAVLVETEEQKIAKLPPKERTRAYEAASKREPRNPKWYVALAREASAADDPRAVIVWSGKALDLEPGGADARALRAHAHFVRGEWAAAKADMDVLAEAELAARPALLGDRFVCLVELKDWAQAADAARAVPASEAARADVLKARQRLASERPAGR